ncbi:MAG TPA: DUF302 domain-containing protein [Longimicrobiales bacterium]|nr:DUF302 domain-containing protein [Longimicrobiales bacterium]
MIQQTTRYGMGATVDLPYASAVELVREALAEQGFGVLTEIDMKATLRNKTGADFRPYVILGACNPTLALRALQAERDIGLLLPCNVIVYADDRPDRSVIAALDPAAALSLADNTELAEVALAVRERLMAALGQVAEAAGALSNTAG